MPRRGSLDERAILDTSGGNKLQASESGNKQASEPGKWCYLEYLEIILSNSPLAFIEINAALKSDSICG